MRGVNRMTIRENVDNKASWESLPIDERNRHNFITYTIDDERHSFVLMGDEHIGSQYYDADTHKSWLEWCYENETPVILMGDELETATKDSVGAGVFEQDEIVQEQLEHAARLYKPLAEEGLIYGVHIGNHEARVYKHSGANLSKILAKLLDIPYLGVGAVHYFRVGDQRYTLYTTHGSSGARLPHTKIKSVLDLANMIDVDIYATGHLHSLDHHVRNFYRPDLRNRTIKEAEKHFILTGSFLKHWGSYAHIKGLEPSKVGAVRLKLSGLERRIKVSM